MRIPEIAQNWFSDEQQHNESFAARGAAVRELPEGSTKLTAPIEKADQS